jgi:cytochrome P450
VAKDRSLIPALVEESIRFESLFHLTRRRAMRDMEIRGTRIAKGSNVFVMIGAANRDETRFEHADRFNIHRDNSGHLGFGLGIHFCLGASLARLEARVALKTLIPLLSGRAPCGEDVERADSFLKRGFPKLTVSRRSAEAAA